MYVTTVLLPAGSGTSSPVHQSASLLHTWSWPAVTCNVNGLSLPAGSGTSSPVQQSTSQFHMAVHRLGLKPGDAVSGSRLPVGAGSLDSQEQEGLRALKDGQARAGR